MKRGAKAGVISAGALLLALAASAYVPSSQAVADAVALGQKEARRSGLTEFRIRVAPGAEGAAFPIVPGTMWSDPEGRAHLELRQQDEPVERQVRQGATFAAARGGKFIRRPRQILPPLWVLQAEEGALLLERLRELGGDPERIELAHDGAHDCFVLGGREGGAAFWIDQYSYRVIRIDLAPGLRYRLGPVTTGDGGGAWPAWVDIEAPGPRRGRKTLKLRLELSPGAAKAADGTAAQDFGDGWLLR